MFLNGYWKPGTAFAFDSPNAVLRPVAQVSPLHREEVELQILRYAQNIQSFIFPLARADILAF